MWVKRARQLVTSLFLSYIYVTHYYKVVVSHNMRVFLRLLLQTFIGYGQFNRVKKEYIILYYTHVLQQFSAWREEFKKTVYNSDLVPYKYMTQFRDNSWLRVFFFTVGPFLFRI